MRSTWSLIAGLPSCDPELRQRDAPAAAARAVRGPGGALAAREGEAAVEALGRRHRELLAARAQRAREVLEVGRDLALRDADLARDVLRRGGAAAQRIGDALAHGGTGLGQPPRLHRRYAAALWRDEPWRRPFTSSR